MAVDPMIARGVNPGAGLVEIFQLAESMKERRQQNELYATEQQQRTQLMQQKLQQEQAAAQKEQEDAQAKQELQYFLPLAKQGNPEAMKVIVERAAKFQPQLADMYRANPEGVGKALIQAGEQMLGIKDDAQSNAGQYQPGNYTTDSWAQFVRTQDPAVLRRYAAPQQYGPESFSPETDAAGNLILVGNRGTIRDTGRKGKAEGPPQPDLAARNATRATDAQNVIDAIDTADQLAGFMTTGFVGQVFRNIGGTDAYDLKAAINTIKGNVGFDRLQRMREESKTGGALGQVAVQELEMLQSTIASLDPDQSEGKLKGSLQKVKSQYVKAMKAYQAAMSQQSANPGNGGGWSAVEIK